MDFKMETLDCSREDDAGTFIVLYKKALEESKRAYGFIHKGFVPYVIAHPELSKKYVQARRTLRLNYWQMPYEDAKKEYRGLPLKTWQKRVDSESSLN